MEAPIGRRCKKVAICGTAPSTMHDVKDLFGKEDWEIWALSSMFRAIPSIIPHVSRWFQLHDRTVIEVNRDPHMWPWFAHQNHFTLYTQVQEPDIPISVAYPRDEVMQDIRELSQDPGFRLFTSTPAWMMALAIHERMDEISLYGLDMASIQEWGFEAPGIRYFIGLGRGMGIKVNVPHKSHLLKSALLYGYDDSVVIGAKFRNRIQNLNQIIREHEYAEQLAHDEKLKAIGGVENMKIIEKDFMYRINSFEGPSEIKE
ncbi:hypothetical protein LCGC14_1137450 [marine sediment metagenome]|uniref:Uncharacterized protein n=1 Tax=marine sediment metagenome TaxID=412755 RepID=A0A0F9Q506_9ZZZZ